MKNTSITEGGFYWYRKDDQHRWSVMEVWRDRGHVLCGPSRHRSIDANMVNNFCGEWIGPIAIPQEKRSVSIDYALIDAAQEWSMARGVIASAAREAGIPCDATSFAESVIARLASHTTPLIIVEAAS